MREFEVSLSFVVLSDPQSTWNTKAKSQKGEAVYLPTSFLPVRMSVFALCWFHGIGRPFITKKTAITMPPLLVADC